MFKYLIIGAALFAGWLYFTDSGNQFYAERLESLVVEKKEEPAFVPDQAKVRRLESLIAEKDSKLAVLRKELEAELKFRSLKSNNTAFRTDPMFLERNMKRVEGEKEVLEAELREMKRPPPGFNAQ